MGEKSKVQIDTFVFDPAKAAANDTAGAVINMTAGTLRWITGAMPTGKTVIKTPTVALILRGTTVTVRVHPDGTTDAIVQDGSVEAVSDDARQTSTVGPGQGVTARPGGEQAAFPGDTDLLDDEAADSSAPQEQRRSNETNAALEHYRYHHQN
jgi:hypothetical protein